MITAVLCGQSNRFPLTSFDRILGFSSFNLTGLIVQPVLFVAGSEALTRWESIETFEALPVGHRQELFLVESANHFALYNEEPYVSQAVARMKAFFDRHV